MFSSQAARKLAITEVDLERSETRLEAAEAYVSILTKCPDYIFSLCEFFMCSLLLKHTPHLLYMFTERSTWPIVIYHEKNVYINFIIV